MPPRGFMACFEAYFLNPSILKQLVDVVTALIGKRTHRCLLCTLPG